MKKIALITLTALLSACSNLSPQKSIAGTYQGTLPCADCEKIQVELVLNADNTYQYNTIYFKNKEQHPFVEKGTFIWDKENTSLIRLSNSGNLTLKTFGDFVEFCDKSGKPVHSYKLNKVK